MESIKSHIRLRYKNNIRTRNGECGDYIVMQNDELIKEYSNIIPNDLKLIIKMLNEPKDDLDWALVAYIFQNTGKGVITLGKISSYFGLDKKECFERLNDLAGFWFSQYLNSSGYRKTYYTYEMNELSADSLVSMMDTLASGFYKRNSRANYAKDEIKAKIKSEKYDKIKAIIDDLGDSERDRSEDEPLMSATTALNAVRDIWKIIYPKKREMESVDKD